MRPIGFKARGATDNPPVRFETIALEREPGCLEEDVGPPTQLYEDRSRSVLTDNDSPDVGFETSLNPYRGCEHGCIYCYARPTHEYLGLSIGLDFETKLFVKREAPELLRKELASPHWRPRTILLSGVTDPYQPVERSLEVTRRCLAALNECRNPVAVTTKSHLVSRDIDLLAELARHGAATVSFSITTLDVELHRRLEPRAASPAKRLSALAALAEQGIPVGVNVAPVIPGLTDHEVPAILEAAAAAGAKSASYIMLRLPHGVAALFEGWLARHYPDRVERVLNRIRDVRGGRLYDSRFGTRMRGRGPLAHQLERLFRVSRRKFGLAGNPPSLSTADFRPPSRGPQLRLFP